MPALPVLDLLDLTGNGFNRCPVRNKFGSTRSYWKARGLICWGIAGLILTSTFAIAAVTRAANIIFL